MHGNIWEVRAEHKCKVILASRLMVWGLVRALSLSPTGWSCTDVRCLRNSPTPDTRIETISLETFSSKMGLELECVRVKHQSVARTVMDVPNLEEQLAENPLFFLLYKKSIFVKCVALQCALNFRVSWDFGLFTKGSYRYLNSAFPLSYCSFFLLPFPV